MFSSKKVYSYCLPPVTLPHPSFGLQTKQETYPHGCLLPRRGEMHKRISDLSCPSGAKKTKQRLMPMCVLVSHQSIYLAEGLV